MSQKDADGENQAEEHEDAPMADFEEPKTKSMTTPKRKASGPEPTSATKRNTATPVKVRTLNKFFPKSAVARSASIVAAMGPLPTKTADISNQASSHYTAPFYIRGSDCGENGEWLRAVGHDEAAMVGLEEYVAANHSSSGEGDGNVDEGDDKEKAGQLIPGFTTHIPKKHDASYADWLEKTFGEDGHQFFNSAHVNVVMHKETGERHWVVNATRLPGAGKVFINSVTKKTPLLDFSGKKIDKDQLQVIIERSQQNYRKELDEDADAARANDEEHIYVELNSKGDISCHPCDCAFLANMPLDVIMAHSNVTGFISPRRLYNTIANMVNRATSKSNKEAKGEGEAQQHNDGNDADDTPESKKQPAKKARTDGTEPKTKKKTAKDEQAEAMALSVDLPVKSKTPKAGPNGSGGISSSSHMEDELLEDVEKDEKVIVTVANNTVNYEDIEEIGKAFASELKGLIDKLEEKQSSVLGLASKDDADKEPERFFDTRLVSKIPKERTTDGERFMAAISNGGACREVVRALLYPSDKTKHEERLVQTLSAITACLGMKSDALSKASPETLKAEFEQLMGLFSTEKTPAWKKTYMPDGKPLDDKAMLMAYAHPNKSPLSRAFFMTGLIAGAVCGSEEQVVQLNNFSRAVKELSHHYSDSLVTASKAVEECVRRSNVQLSNAQKRLHEQFEVEKKELLDEKLKVEQAADKLKEENQKAQERITDLEKQLKEAKEAIRPPPAASLVAKPKPPPSSAKPAPAAAGVSTTKAPATKAPATKAPATKAPATNGVATKRPATEASDATTDAPAPKKAAARPLPTPVAPKLSTTPKSAPPPPPPKEAEIDPADCF